MTQTDTSTEAVDYKQEFIKAGFIVGKLEAERDELELRAKQAELREKALLDSNKKHRHDLMEIGHYQDKARQLKAENERLKAREDAVWNEAIEAVGVIVDERHVVYMTAKGRNPKDYISEWSLTADQIRTLKHPTKGESHE